MEKFVALCAIALFIGVLFCYAVDILVYYYQKRIYYK